MDKTTVFGTVDVGSIPARGTLRKQIYLLLQGKQIKNARVVELVDTQRSERCLRKEVEVQVLSRAQIVLIIWSGEANQLLDSREDLNAGALFFQ